ncbi:Aste57867_23764 [Aphanomyces stellatus]|uniref:Aste57867_23764 protein n=1 Tax=Aphanomyces stellatus TaxID=120398 RepID=A0A485LPD0_9STRA|nr:hypothetical protein As57867_023692 [Aphanomyces stellatus]VFU00409.1 Aste57867_23764 [Aphanomyces stellatus]
MTHNQSSHTTLPNALLEPELALSDVSFHNRAHFDTFRVQIFARTNSGSVPMRLWFESTQSKGQWDCVVTDIQDHSPKDANYVLPLDFVVGSLKTGLTALADGLAETNQNMSKNDCVLTLKDRRRGCLRLVMTISCMGSLLAEYAFDLTPVVIDKVDVVEAKVRDVLDALPRLTTEIDDMKAKISSLETDLANALKTRFPLCGLFTLTKSAAPSSSLSWQMDGPETFKLSDDNRTICLDKAGVYMVEAYGVIGYSERGCGMRLVLSDGRAILSPVGHGEPNDVVSISHMFSATKDTTLRFQCFGSYKINSGAKLTVVLLHPFPEISI